MIYKSTSPMPVTGYAELLYFLGKGWTIAMSWEYPRWHLVQPYRHGWFNKNADGSRQIILEIGDDLIHKLIRHDGKWPIS